LDIIACAGRNRVSRNHPEDVPDNGEILAAPAAPKSRNVPLGRAIQTTDKPVTVSFVKIDVTLERTDQMIVNAFHQVRAHFQSGTDNISLVDHEIVFPRLVSFESFDKTPHSVGGALRFEEAIVAVTEGSSRVDSLPRITFYDQDRE